MEEQSISLWKLPVMARGGGNPEGWDFKSTDMEFHMQIKITLVYQIPGM